GVVDLASESDSGASASTVRRGQPAAALSADADERSERRSIMLKFLTHKLRTHSLNEESVSEKVEERDSGTESDDEAERAEPGDFCTDVIMKWNDVTDISMGGEACACAPTPPRLLPEPEPDHLYDHHSSEEELEVFHHQLLLRMFHCHTVSMFCNLVTTVFCFEIYLESYSELISISTFCRTRRDHRGPCKHDTRHTRSPRRRRLPLPPPRRHRPALDFDKMQQLKVGGGVRSWRAVGGAHGGELSVFCW
ncbi:uncharacterized protein LOC111348234, partial [Spodoptera litura]|uniref:Uncharacterized protein LOC111348234 n=1 Tax=Spodoptera litura TaxID=69820 RepID=A0A9J7IHE8_SPOLT